MSVTSSGQGLADIFEAVEALLNTEVLVGIPEGEVREGGMTNAQIGYLQETGSPAMNLPDRPFLVPGIELVQDKIGEFLVKAADASLSGKSQQVFNLLGKAGMTAQNSVRLYFVSGSFTPLSPATIADRLSKNRNKAEFRKNPKPRRNSDQPLIDTVQLRKSVTYVVKKGDKEVSSGST